MSNDTTRRRMLQGGAGLLLAGLAGCGSIPGVQGGGGSYTNWVYEPGAIGDNEHLSVTVAQIGQIVEHEDELDDGYETFESRVEDQYSVLGLDIEDVQQLISLNAGRVLTGSFDLESIRSDLEDADYDDSEYQGYDVFVGPNERTGFALQGNTIVQTRYTDPESTLEELIDTNRGETDRYVDENDAFSELVSQLGSGTYLFGGTHEEYESTNEQSFSFEHQVARGASVTLNGDTANVKRVLVFEDSGDIDMDDVEDAIDEQSDSNGQFSDVDDIETSQSGRSVIITGTMDTDELF